MVAEKPIIDEDLEFKHRLSVSLVMKILLRVMKERGEDSINMELYSHECKFNLKMTTEEIKDKEW